MVTHVVNFEGMLRVSKYWFALQEPRHVEVAWGQVVVVQADDGVAYLQEKDLSAKLELLFSKSLYLVALNLATSEEVHPMHSCASSSEHLHPLAMLMMPLP